jgi:hypothetical protein
MPHSPIFVITPTLLGYNQSFAKGSGQYKDFQDSLSNDQRQSFQDASRLIEQTSQNFNISYR